MKTMVILLTLAALALPLRAQTATPRLDSEPDVVHLEGRLRKPLVVEVVKDAQLYSNRKGGLRLGSVRAGQQVEITALTDKLYRVRGTGADKNTAGWAGTWAFAAKDPAVIEQLMQFYDREVQVRALIQAGELAVGMTLDEVSQVRGKPTKSSVRKTEKGQTGKWEWVEYREQKHYITRVDPSSGAAYRQFSHTTQIEKSRTAVEFEDGVVTAIEESKNRGEGGVRIVVPPVVFGW